MKTNHNKQTYLSNSERTLLIELVKTQMDVIMNKTTKLTSKEIQVIAGQQNLIDRLQAKLTK